MSRWSSHLIVTTIALSSLQSASADLFTYQGQLKNNGVAATGNYDFVFTLYDTQAPGGAVIAGPTTVGNVPTIAGLFSVQLDFGFAPFRGADRYLEISVNPTGGGAATTLSPRQLLTATPYALFSKTGSATQLQQRDISSGVPAAGQVLKWGGAAWTPSADNDTTYLAGAGLSLAGTTFSIANNAVTNAMLANDALSLNKVSAGAMTSSGGLIGISDPSPATALSVGSGHKFQVAGSNGSVTFTDQNATITFPAASGSPPPMIQMFGSGTGNADRMVIAHSSAFPNYGLQYQDTADKFHFLAAGNPVLTVDLIASRVGVGTSSPAFKLDVADRMRIRQGSSASAGLNFYQTTPAADRAFIGMFNDTTVGLYGYTGSGWSFLMDTTSGNIGIGTTDLATGAKLAVNGKVLCTEVEVQLAADWPDYVFDEKYALAPLSELEQRLRRDRHLPGLPSVKQVERDGVSVGKMQTQLLEKVEELTLYVIKLDKQLGEVTEENARLRRRLAVLDGKEGMP